MRLDEALIVVEKRLQQFQSRQLGGFEFRVGDDLRVDLFEHPGAGLKRGQRAALSSSACLRSTAIRMATQVETAAKVRLPTSNRVNRIVPSETPPLRRGGCSLAGAGAVIGSAVLMATARNERIATTTGKPILAGHSGHVKSSLVQALLARLYSSAGPKDWLWPMRKGP